MQTGQEDEEDLGEGILDSVRDDVVAKAGLRCD